LRVQRDADRLVLDFPARPATPVASDPEVCRALGIPADTPMLLARDLLVVLNNAEQVRQLTPDFAALASADYFGICVTARGDDCDFVSRFFAPRQGINEDPVTGSAHCTLAPYWQQQLQRDTLTARQLSARGGVLRCELRDDRVLIGGTAHCYLRGEISVPDSIETLEN
jgi:predicted PhzF superfamily epimerase YddE/YHI9